MNTRLVIYSMATLFENIPDDYSEYCARDRSIEQSRVDPPPSPQASKWRKHALASEPDGNTVTHPARDSLLELETARTLTRADNVKCGITRALANRAFREACAGEVVGARHKSAMECYALRDIISRGVISLDVVCGSLPKLRCEDCWSALLDEFTHPRDKSAGDGIPPCIAHRKAREPECIACAVMMYGYARIADSILIGRAHSATALRFAFVGASRALDGARALCIFVSYAQRIVSAQVGTQTELITGAMHDMISAACEGATRGSVRSASAARDVAEFLSRRRFPCDWASLWRGIDIALYAEAIGFADVARALREA
jgi:hypothetical protein